MRIVAHRGAHGPSAPENTIAALSAAAAIFRKHGAPPVVEVDLRASAEGTPFLFHDRTLERLAGCAGRIEDLSDAEVRRLRVAGHTVPGHTVPGHAVPTLGEALDALPEDAEVFLEVKTDDPDLPARWRPLWRGRNVVVSSFHDRVTAAAARLGERTHYLTKTPDAAAFARAAELGAEALDAPVEACSFVPRTAGTPVFVYVVNDEAAWRAAEAAGAVGIFTDRLEWALKR